MAFVRAMGWDENGNFWVEPNWMPEGVRTGLSADEIATINDTGQPISSFIFHLQTAAPWVESPTIKDPTKAANAKAQTLQTRLDGLMDAEGRFHAGALLVAVDKATQEIAIVPVPLSAKEKADMDAALEAVFVGVSVAQAEHIKKNALFAQVKAGGTKPEYQKDALLVSLPAGYAVDQYHGPKGAGYLVRAEVFVRGDRYVRAKQFGPNDWMETDWAES